jgi:hypothetical protein
VLLLLAGYVLVLPPVFVLGPLAGLLAVSRPSTPREWAWLAFTGLVAAVSLLPPGGVAGDFTRAAGVLIAGAFVVLSVWRPSPVFHRAILATGAGLVVTLAATAAMGARWPVVEQAVATQTREYFQAQVRQADSAGLSPSMVDGFRRLTVEGPAAAPFYPAGIALAALAGLVLAWHCYRIVSRRPVGPAAAPLGEFRFSDHAVWVPVAGLAVLLLGRAELPLMGMPLGTWAGNLLAVSFVVYVARGLGVFASAARRTPRRVVVVLGAVALLFWPFAAGGLLLLGLADSWVDFRRRLAAPPTGGMNR